MTCKRITRSHAILEEPVLEHRSEDRNHRPDIYDGRYRLLHATAQGTKRNGQKYRGNTYMAAAEIAEKENGEYHEEDVFGFAFNMNAPADGLDLEAQYEADWSACSPSVTISNCSNNDEGNGCRSPSDTITNCSVKDGDDVDFFISTKMFMRTGSIGNTSFPPSSRHAASCVAAPILKPRGGGWSRR